MNRPDRRDTLEKQVVKDEVSTPIGGVRLADGLFRSAFMNNIDFLNSLSVDSILYWFRAKASRPAPGKPYRGHFEDNIKG